MYNSIDEIDNLRAYQLECLRFMSEEVDNGRILEESLERIDKNVGIIWDRVV